jgi:hypothetical protein
VIRVIALDDHAIVRDDIARLLGTQPDMGRDPTSRIGFVRPPRIIGSTAGLIARVVVSYFSRWCFRLNFRSKSGQNSFRMLPAMSTLSCMLSFDTALEAVRLSG